MFVNDTSPVGAGKARVTVRHVAAAPAVDVRAGGTPVISGLTNPNEQSLVVDAGTIAADVTLAGTGTVVLGPADLNLAEGTSTIVYAWGSASQNNLALAVQTIEGLHSTPAGVPGGEAGLIDDDSATATRWLAAAAIASAGCCRRRAALAAATLGAVRPFGRLTRQMRNGGPHRAGRRPALLSLPHAN